MHGRDDGGVNANGDVSGAGDVSDGRAEAHDGTSRRDRALAALRARGERVTPGRRTVIEVLDEQQGHLDAEAVAALVDEREPGIHRATIYRSLQALVEAGIVTHTHVPGGATIYHLATLDASAGAGSGADAAGGVEGSSGHRHAHLQCARCGRFTDVDVAEFAPLVARIRELTGFAVDAEHGALLGTCAQCSAQESAAAV